LAASHSNIQKLRSEQIENVTLRLHSAQEISLLGHSLIDELSSLFGQLLSDNSLPSEPPTLLEDLESMHRRLREQESVRAYVQVIHRALQLRCAETQTHSSFIVSNLPFSEAATAEICPNSPIIVSKYRALQTLVSAVKRGCSPASDVAEEVDISLRLVSFLEETQGQTWLNMKAVLSRYVTPTSHNCSL
jgi:RAD50-interacting protein 1